jgi:uncharacterized protein YbaP (TraB family)
MFIVALNSKIILKERTSLMFKEMSLWIYCFHEFVHISILVFGSQYFLGQLANSSLTTYFIVAIVTTIIAYYISAFRLKGINLSSKKTVIACISLPLLIIITSQYAINKNSDSNYGSEEFQNSVFVTSETSESSNVIGPMWKISDDDSSIYIYGTADCGYKSLFPLSSIVEDALKASDEVVFSASFYTKEEIPLANELYNSNEASKNFLTEEAYDSLENQTKHLKWEKNFGSANVLALSQFIILNYQQSDSLNSEYSVDQYMRYRARKLNKNITSMYSLYDIDKPNLTNATDEVYNAYAMITKFYDESYSDEFSKYFDYWKAGDVAKGVNLLKYRKFYDEATQKEYDKYNTIIQDYHNKVKHILDEKILTNLYSYLEDNKLYFVCLDPTNFNNDNDVISVIESKGYKVERITE